MSICIDCKKGADECEWLFRLRPVKGWEAKKVRCSGFITYEVTGCPNYEKNRENKRRRRTKIELAAQRQMQASELAVKEALWGGN